jgi:hypothetical protein
MAVAYDYSVTTRPGEDPCDLVDDKVTSRDPVIASNIAPGSLEDYYTPSPMLVARATPLPARLSVGVLVHGGRRVRGQRAATDSHSFLGSSRNSAVVLSGRYVIAATSQPGASQPGASRQVGSD